ncbi:unnamed protein product [Taenia asiatica]|uniref:Kazal-like domain-containing protein n=1 Tax=Taenia asiatica TaxID=60517 RepID=A0A0R3VZJ1_TAEAS|nr:unnamed protein product [Taenia asiatica]
MGRLYCLSSDKRMHPCCNKFLRPVNGCGTDPRDDKIYVNQGVCLRRYVDDKYLDMFTAMANAKAQRRRVLRHNLSGYIPPCKLTGQRETD